MDLDAYQEDIDFYSALTEPSVYVVVQEQVNEDVNIDVFSELSDAIKLAHAIAAEYGGGEYVELTHDRECDLLLEYRDMDSLYSGYVYVMEKCLR